MDDWKPEYLGQPRPNKAHHPGRVVSREAHAARQQGQQQQQPQYDMALGSRGLNAAKLGALRGGDRSLGMFA